MQVVENSIKIKKEKSSINLDHKNAGSVNSGSVKLC